MKNIKTFESFLGFSKPKSNINLELEQYLIDAIEHSNIKLNHTSGMYSTIFFNIVGVGNITIGNYEFEGDGRSFSDEHKSIKGFKYRFKPLEVGSVKSAWLESFDMSDGLSKAILNGLKSDVVKDPFLDKLKDIKNLKSEDSIKAFKDREKRMNK